MKKITQTSFFLLLAFAGLFILSSFSLVPAVDVRDENPPIEKKKKNRRQVRLNKRYNRLYQRFDQTKNTKQRHRLQKKIRHVERQQDSNPTPIVGIIGLALGVLAFILFVAALASLAVAARAASMGLASSTATGGILFIVGLIAAFAGLIVSIISLVLNKTKPERHNLKGFGIAGIIVSSVFILILTIANLAFFLASK